ncbi:MAG TPA: thiamine pyrophosphate-dependent enzyme, partial [Burkholderiales bacterium]|nr:thiamine pyrophosphate-dependent enzyme [Burkholderiales bacterium]
PRKIDIGIVGDCKAVLQQLLAAMPRRIEPENFAQWRKKLAEGEAAKRKETGGGMSMNKTPIHPLRLCEEVKNFMKRDAILVVDGQEILNYGRQSMPTFSPGHRLNSGPFGMMGVGMPFGVGAKIACPDKQVIVVHGDGSFGLNAMELDTAVRHKVPVLVVISLNGGWTADPKKEKIGRNLGYTRFDKMAEALGCYGEFVEKPEDIGPALVRAQKKVDQGMVALVNVVTDDTARAGTVSFSSHAAAVT